jgi:guanine deaminase
VVKAIRGRLLWYVSDPETDGPAARRYHEDGLLVVENGLVREAGTPRRCCGPYRPERRSRTIGRISSCRASSTRISTIRKARVVASFGATLLEWLERYTFVEEQLFADPDHAAAGARFFLDELLRVGTTTACIYCTVHPGSAEALFAESERRGTRMAAGKVMMDRGRTAGPARHRRERVSRFEGAHRTLARPGTAILRDLASLRPDLDGGAARCRRSARARASGLPRPDAYLREPAGDRGRRGPLSCDRDYASVYDRFGLLGPRSLMGHCLICRRTSSSFCTGAGGCGVLPDLEHVSGQRALRLGRMRDPRHPVRIAVATDIGGGTSYSMLATMGEAYKVLHLQGQTLTPDAAFHAMTRGNAVALGIEALVGSFEPGRECDAVVLDGAATPAMARRMERVRTLDEELFLLATMGDDRAVAATYVMGELAHQRQKAGA